MARDRKRSKQRRARQSGEGARAAGSDRADVARDAGLEDDAVSSPLGEGTGAPSPLTNASAEVDQARIAESGAVRGGSGDAEAEAYDAPYEPSGDREVAAAPDEVEGDQLRGRGVSRRDLDPSVAEETDPVASERKSRGRVLAFLGHCVDELRRVQWPDRRQVGQATAVVLGFVVIAGGYLGLMDAIWKPLVQAIL